MIDGRPGLLHFFDLVDDDRVRRGRHLLGAASAARSGRAGAELGERAVLLHVKDGPAADPRRRWSRSATARSTCPAVVAASPSARWHIVELDRCDTDMFDAVERSYHYLVDNGLSRGRSVTASSQSRDCRVRGHQPRVRAHVEQARLRRRGGVRRRVPRAGRGARGRAIGIPRSLTFDEVLDRSRRSTRSSTSRRRNARDVTSAALDAGKSVFSEKPLASTFEEGAGWSTAGARGLRLGCAPDTFLGAGFQTCRVIDPGAIGEPLGANAFMLSPGPEAWHPRPEIFYEYGAGPMFDMGPYYLTALYAARPGAAVTARRDLARRNATIGSGAAQGE